MNLTVIIPTFNEEKHIAEAIASVDFADEILVIDSFSTDSTLEIAQRLKVKVIQRKFDDFSSQKNYAIQQAKYEWILLIDADERVTKLLKEEIQERLSETTEFDAFWIYRTYHFMGNKIKYSGWQRDKVVRLFKGDTCQYNGKLVHEEIESTGQIGFLKNKLEHYTYSDIDSYMAKINKYAWLQARERHSKGERFSIIKALVKPPYRFFNHYVLRAGFLDGFPGFVIAIVQSYGVFSRYLKLWLIERKQN